MGPFLLSGRTALVTGGAGAIGSAVCRALAAHGAIVHCLDLDASRVEGVVRTITADGGQATGHVADITERAQVFALVEGVGDLDVLVNTAAWIQYRPIGDFDEATIDRMLAVGLKGAMWTVQAASVRMRPGGSIINFSSTTSLRTSDGHFVYAALKGAINTMTMQSAVELGPRGIRVNAVAPGLVLHNGNRPRLTEDFIDLHRRTTPLGRPGEPEDIAGVVVFLASDLSRWVTGLTIPVDGGRVSSS